MLIFYCYSSIPHMYYVKQINAIALVLFVLLFITWDCSLAVLSLHQVLKSLVRPNTIICFISQIFIWNYIVPYV